MFYTLYKNNYFNLNKMFIVSYWLEMCGIHNTRYQLA